MAEHRGVPKSGDIRTLYRYCLLTALVVAATIVIVSWSNAWSSSVKSRVKPRLSFRRSYNNDESSTSRHAFKVLQLTDLHFGEAEDTEWGPQQDVKSARAIRTLLNLETPVDLVVLSGDQLTANDIDRNATLYYQQLIDILLSAQPDVQWCMVFGNHDDARLEHKLKNGTRVYTDAKTKRSDLIKLDMSYPGSWTNTTTGLFGTSNYKIPLFLNNQAVADIFLFDSGGGSLPIAMRDNQLAWFRNESSNGSQLPAVAFQHIPTSTADFAYADDGSCVGMNGDGGVNPLDTDPGVLHELIQHGNVHFLATGHDHGNDFCCKHAEQLSICFGRHSGYGGYGSWDRGTRVYELTIGADNDFSWQSWVRLESGEVIHHYSPPNVIEVK